MLLTLDRLIEKLKIPLEDTVYSQDKPDVRNYRFSAGDFFAIEKGSKVKSIYNSGQTVDGSQGKLSWEESEYYKNRLKDVEMQLKALKSDEEDITHAHAEEIKELRREKKRIKAYLEENMSRSADCSMIKFKNCLYAISFSALCRSLPEMTDVRFRDILNMPLFVAGLDYIRDALDRHSPIGISGGPCLFGVNEIYMAIILNTGETIHYDYSGGRNYVNNTSETSLADDIISFGSQVVSVVFDNRKKGITSQEYDSIHCLFETARALKAKLTIPLPDMSYIKYLKNIIEGLPVDIGKKVVTDFQKEAFAITDMYLELIEKMRQMYPEVEVAVFHARDEKLCEIFYEKRAEFLTESVVRLLTGIRGKNEAIQDYITMPALPYYLWGIRDIIQMDSLDETDSYRKCAKTHKSVIHLCAILYPERISEDGENTIFYAPLEYKEYLVQSGG